MQHKPLITVVIPTHNREDLLAEAIDSLMSQTMPHWEAIIVDDASMKPVSLPNDNRFKILRHEKSQGGSASKNTGILNSQAPVVAFLDDDDLYQPEYLEMALNELARNDDIEVLFMGVKWFGSMGHKGQQAYDKAMQNVLANTLYSKVSDNCLLFNDVSLFKSLLNTVPMAFQRPVVRKKVIERIGFYQSDILLWDCDWALRAALMAKCALLDLGVYMQRAEGQGYSSKGNRYLEHLLSNAMIKERLLISRHPGSVIKMIRYSAADAYFNIAWHHYRHGRKTLSLKYLVKSVYNRPRISCLKLMLRLPFSTKT